MTTATAPIREQVITEVIDRDDGQRVHRYRWTVGEHSGTGAALETVVPVPPAILADRWAGLTDETELQDRLDAALNDLAGGVTRRSIGTPDMVVVDGEIIGADNVMDLDGLQRVIRDWILERAARIAR